MESNKFDFVFIFRIVRENFKVFLLVGICVGILAVIFSGPTFMKPKFKSTAVVYPVNIESFSDESQTEQLLQVFESNSIKNHLIDKYNLYERYEIEPGVPSSKHYMNLEYNDRVVFSKTSYESVLLEVFDEDPEIAKSMADEVLLKVNETIRGIRNSWGQGRAESFKIQMDHQLDVIDSLEKEIQLITQEKRLFDYQAQSRELTRAYLAEVSKNKNSQTVEDLEEWIDNLGASGSRLKALQHVSEFAAEQYGFATEKYLYWMAKGDEDMDYMAVVVSPEVADKKSWPVRWLILASSIAVGMILTLFALAIVKYSKS